MTSRLVRAYRVLRFVLHVLQGLATVAFAFPFLSRERRGRLIRRWAAGSLEIFNVKVGIRGQAPQPGAAGMVFVANHISWLDPALIMARYPAHFVAKAEIRSWPLLGWLAEKAGTLFIERGRRHDTARINQSLSQALAAGDCVGVFPEATTTDGTTLKPFHSSLLQAAVLAQAELYPVAIRYRHPDGSHNTAVAYTGNLSFAGSLKRVLAEPAIHAELTFAAPLPPQGKSRRELASLAEQAIAGLLQLPAPGRKPETLPGPPAALLTKSPPTGSPCPAPEDSGQAAAPAPTSGQR